MNHVQLLGQLGCLIFGAAPKTGPSEGPNWLGSDDSGRSPPRFRMALSRGHRENLGAVDTVRKRRTGGSR